MHQVHVCTYKFKHRHVHTSKYVISDLLQHEEFWMCIFAGERERGREKERESEKEKEKEPKKEREKARERARERAREWAREWGRECSGARECAHASTRENVCGCLCVWMWGCVSTTKNVNICLLLCVLVCVFVCICVFPPILTGKHTKRNQKRGKKPFAGTLGPAPASSIFSTISSTTFRLYAPPCFRPAMLPRLYLFWVCVIYVYIFTISSHIHRFL